MTLGDIALKARMNTLTDTTSYPDANLLIDINIWYQKVVSMILESADESNFDDARNTNYPIIKTSMVANQRDYGIGQTYKALKIKRVDLTYDGTNYYRATPIDSGEITFGLGNDSNTDNNFIQIAPRYDVKYNSIFIYPMPLATDVTAGGKIVIEYERDVTPFVVTDYTSVLTDSTVVPGFDDPFHPMLSAGAGYEYANSHQLPSAASFLQELTDYEVRLRQAYGRKNVDRHLTFASYMDDSYGR